MTLHESPFTKEEFKDSIQTVIKPLIDEKNIQFIFQMNCGVECINVDRLRFCQIFFNLLSNAAKFTSMGGTIEFVTVESAQGMENDSTKYRYCDILNMFFIYKNEDCDAEAIDKGFFNYTREEVFILNCLRIFTEYGLYEDVDKSLPISTICDYAAIAAETVIDDYDGDQVLIGFRLLRKTNA